MAQQIVNETLADGEVRPQRGRVRGRRRSAGQVLVIFALSSVVFVGMCAVVVDVAWYWSNNLRVQRAADAAALAGAVLLPGDITNAVLRAKAEATKNGYTTGGGVIVTPCSDANLPAGCAGGGGNDHQLNVTVTAPVPTFFMRVFGINSINAVRSSKAEFVLPVPMGSPQNYYGVGQFLGTPTVPPATRWPSVAVPGGSWTTPLNANGTIDTNRAISTGTDGSKQQWSTFNFTGASAIPTGATITAVQLGIRAFQTGTGNSQCRLNAALSWDNGNTWTTTTVATPVLATAETFYALPASGNWGTHTWVPADFANANFQVRLTYDSAVQCNAARRANVDTIEVTVATNATVETQLSVNNPMTLAPLTPQNFWGAMFTKGGSRQNGDYYGPSTIGSSSSGVYNSTDLSPTYTPDGYDYTVDFTGSTNGQVQLFDPEFCATGPNLTSGWYGAGDHWTTHGSTGGNDIAPVAVTYRLYKDVFNTPYIPGDDTLVGTPLAYDPANKTLGDFSGAVGAANKVQNFGDADARDCANDAGHNRWVVLGSGLAGGMYRVNVDTSSQTANQDVGAENLFSIWVDAAGGKARVYGGGRMAGYTQIGNAAQSFYLAQIEQVHAGKTLQIQLFDPGDVSGDAFLHIQSPDGNVYNDVTFDYQADSACKAGNSDNCTGTNRTAIQTTKAGSSSFDNSMITITIKLPDTYGSGGLTPPGVPGGGTAADKAGWWKINYIATNANDTTTWMVNILGNPVHLKVP